MHAAHGNDRAPGGNAGGLAGQCGEECDVAGDLGVQAGDLRCTVAVVANYGANARALFDVLTGAAEAKGKLPFDLPSSMAAVEASREDMPFDTKDPLFRFGHGLTV